MSDNQNFVMANACMLEDTLSQYEWVTLCVAEIGSTDDDWDDVIIPAECLNFDRINRVLTFSHPCLRRYKVPYGALATAKPMPNGTIKFNPALAMMCRVSGLKPVAVDSNL